MLFYVFVILITNKNIYIILFIINMQKLNLPSASSSVSTSVLKHQMTNKSFDVIRSFIAITV